MFSRFLRASTCEGRVRVLGQLSGRSSMLLALSQDDDLGILQGHDHVAADAEVIAQINQPASGPEPGRASL